MIDVSNKTPDWKDAALKETGAKASETYHRALTEQAQKVAFFRTPILPQIYREYR